jgi:hypothetical protein
MGTGFIGVVIIWSVASFGADSMLAVRAVGISERRTQSFYKDDPIERASQWPPPQVTTVTVELTGKLARTATRFAAVEIEGADDQGHAIKVLPPPSERWKPVQRDNVHEDRVRVPINIETPPRTATKLASLHGSVRLLTGNLVDLRVDKVANRVGKPLAVKELEDAGVRVTVTGFSTTGWLTIELAGRIERVERIGLVDYQGATLLPNRAEFHLGQVDPPWKRTLEWTPPLQAEGVLQIVLLAGAAEVQAPIDLKNVQLP